MTSRGMMAENMFTGKGIILGWLNSSFNLRLDKIEDTCNGAVACQIMDYLHPGSVNMKKVDFNVKNAYEYVGNYKELQQAFNRVGIDRAFNVQALSKGKLQDNNEFMQWFKGYWDDRTGGQDMEEYDAAARRALCKTGDCRKFSGSDAMLNPPGSAATIPAIRRSGMAGGARPPGARGVAGKVAPRESAGASQSRVEALSTELEEMATRLETAERERDFYFDKLRDIEIMCQTPEFEKFPVIKFVERVLYAADGDEAKLVLAEAESALKSSDKGPDGDLIPLAQQVNTLLLDAGA